jgi:hypothetical protein
MLFLYGTGRESRDAQAVDAKGETPKFDDYQSIF